MLNLRFDPELIIPLVVFAIPIIAITGGIIAGIVKTLGRQRVIELAQRERIAAIERGVDLSKVPPIQFGGGDVASWLEFADRHDSPLRRAQGLLIGGVITLFAGIGIVVFLILIKPDSEKPFWAVGLIPAFVGAALLLSAKLVWPRPNGGGAAPRG